MGSQKTAKFVAASLRLAMVLLLVGGGVGLLQTFFTLGFLPYLTPWLNLYELHPRLLVYGFFGIFLVNDAFIFFPERKLESPKLKGASACIGLLIASLVLLAIPYNSSRVASRVLTVAAAALYLRQTNLLCNRPPKVASDLILRLNGLFFLGGTLVDFGNTISNRFISGAYWGHIMTLGFLSLAIMNEEARTFAAFLGKGRLRTRLMQVGALLWAAGAALYYLSSYLQPVLAVLAVLLEASALVCFLHSIRAFERGAAAEGESSTVRTWFRRHTYTGFAWAVLGILLLLSDAVSHFLGLRAPTRLYDAYLHSITIGFILVTLLGYEPVLMPVHLGLQSPQKFSYQPFVLVNVGNVLRVFGDLTSASAAISLGVSLTAAGVLIFIKTMKSSLHSAS